VSELDDLVRDRRFDDISQARQQVYDDKRQLDDALASGRVDDGTARMLYQRSITRYVQQLETLLNPPRDPDDDEKERNPYWFDHTIGAIKLPDGTAMEVNGLLGFLELDEVIRVRVETQHEGRYFEAAETQTEVRAVQPSWRVLDSAVRTAHAAGADLGLEINPSSESSDLYDVRNDPDDYDEPINDGINKPQSPD